MRNNQKETYEFLLDKAIGMNEKLKGRESYEFAEIYLLSFAEELKITDQHLIIEGDIKTFTVIIADLIEEYLKRTNGPDLSKYDSENNPV